MKLYNTLTRKLETFKPLDVENVKIYTCGPTVYDFAHIGNLSGYIYWDLLIQVLKRQKTEDGENWRINRVMNITDVGHLTSDADEGVDKLEKGAAREHKTVWEVAEFYMNKFLDDFHALNLDDPDSLCRATDYIKQDKNLVDTLTQKGYTYETKDGIYFDTSKFPTYADFAKLDLDHLKAGARVDFNSEKRNVSDFALWKFIQPGEDHAMQWQYLGRAGYPGWHIECATIVHEELGETIDIHTGGIDHIPVHHTNEIAELEAFSGKRMSNFWLHCNFVNISGEKISKSLGNFYTLDQLKEMGYDPLDFKMWVLQGHFMSERNFKLEDLSSAKIRRLKWKNRFAVKLAEHLKNQGAGIGSHQDIQSEILEKLEDNLNSPEAFSIIDTHLSELSYNDWKEIDSFFKLGLSEAEEEITPQIPEVERLTAEREEARKNKDYAVADDIRDDLANMNITVLDSPSGPIWQFIK